MEGGSIITHQTIAEIAVGWKVGVFHKLFHKGVTQWILQLSEIL